MTDNFREEYEHAKKTLAELVEDWIEHEKEVRKLADEMDIWGGDYDDDAVVSPGAAGVCDRGG